MYLKQECCLISPLVFCSCCACVALIWYQALRSLNKLLCTHRFNLNAVVVQTANGRVHFVYFQDVRKQRQHDIYLWRIVNASLRRPWVTTLLTSRTRPTTFHTYCMLIPDWDHVDDGVIGLHLPQLLYKYGSNHITSVAVWVLNLSVSVWVSSWFYYMITSFLTPSYIL